MKKYPHVCFIVRVNLESSKLKMNNWDVVRSKRTKCRHSLVGKRLKIVHFALGESNEYSRSVISFLLCVGVVGWDALMGLMDNKYNHKQNCDWRFTNKPNHSRCAHVLGNFKFVLQKITKLLVVWVACTKNEKNWKVTAVAV